MENKKSSNIKPENLKDYMSIKEAAEFLGVDKMTLRRWDNAGKLRAFRHPVSDWRLYKRDDLEALLKEITK